MQQSTQRPTIPLTHFKSGKNTEDYLAFKNQHSNKGN